MKTREQMNCADFNLYETKVLLSSPWLHDCVQQIMFSLNNPVQYT